MARVKPGTQRKNKKSEAVDKREQTNRRTVLMLHGNGFTRRQIAEKANLSVETVQSLLEVSAEELKEDNKKIASAIRDLSINQCDETLGQLADMMVQADKLRPLHDRILVKRQLISEMRAERRMKVDILGIEAPKQIQHSGSLEFNDLRERNTAIDTADKTATEIPAVLGKI